MEDVNLKTEETLDQLAVASENVAHAVRQSNSSSKDLREQRSSIPSSIDATVRYENSNGFVPIILTVTPSYDNRDATSAQTDDLEQQDERSEKSNATNAVSARESSSATPKKLEEDLVYSSEARIFLNPGPLTNRRSFDFQDRPNEFELLKVNNDTPAVANYQDFYENVRSTANTETDGGADSSSSGRLSGKKVENHIRNYAQQSYRNSDVNLYTRHYNSHNSAQDTKKIAYEQEKVPHNYRQQDTANYDGHGQSVARQSVATIPSSSRTNYEVNEPTHSGMHGGTYDNTADSSRTRHRFSRPVVVAEPSNYKVDTKFNGQLRNDGTSNDHETLRKLETSSSETNRYEPYNDNSRQRSYHRSEDSENFSDESTDYSEYIERPRRLQKNRRRPAYSDSSRKLPKEHRDSSEESAEEQGKHKYSSSKLKSQRHKVKANPWVNDPSANHHDDSLEGIVKHDSRGGGTSSKLQYGSRPKNTNGWNQISPNLEISHSNGIELDQMEKPKYIVPLNVNLVPLTNFDHATALGSSQGFDVSNAVMQNFVTTAPIGAFSTSAPLLSTPQSVLAQNLALSKNLANMQNLVSTPAPDIIVGQSSFHNPMHTVLLPQQSVQSKVADTLRTTYLPSTMAPVFALTSSLSPTLQSVRLQDNVTPRTAFAVTPTPTSVVQHIPMSQVHAGVQQLIVPQPTVQTFSNFLQTPLQANSGYQIHVNPHGLQGQNVINHGSLQMPGLSTTPTLLTGQTIPSRINMAPVDFHSKKNTYAVSDTGNFLATASLAVGQNDQKQAFDTKAKAFAQATQTVPTVLQPSPTLNSMNAQHLIPGQQNLQNVNHVLQRSRDHQYVKMHSNSAEDAMQQLQMQLNRAQMIKNDNKLSGLTLQTADNAGSHSNNVKSINLLTATSGNAHLPNVGAKNVEIVNPNIKPSPIDTTVNAFNAMHYPAAVLTTPIPIFSTITPITPHTVHLQSYVDSLTESGAKAKQLGVLDSKMLQHHERPMFNPTNFVPNVDILKNQNALNNKLPANEPLQQGLNLVPIMPGGNFFKPSFAAQSELVMKPKLTSDLQKYAEEMFKESLKTMYNSQKWNNDRKPNGNNSEANDLAKLQMELQKLRTSLSGSKYKDILEAHHSENKLRLSDAPNSSSNDKKKPDPLLATLEHLLKTRPPGPIHIYHGSSRPGRKPGPGVHDDFNGNSHLKEFLTPPRPSPFHSMGPFHDKPMKKRPGVSRYKNGLRKPARPGSSPSRSNGLETSASTINLHLDGSHYHRSPFDRDIDFDPRHQPPFDTYPRFTASTPDMFNDILRELKASKNKDYDMNHPRMHNFLGLLMKNKQLPTRSVQNRYRDKDQLRQLLESEKHRLQQLFYDDAVRDYILDKFEGASQSGPIAGRKVYSRNGTA